MASITDVFNALNDIKARLDSLHADNVSNGSKLDTIDGKLDAIDQQERLTNQLVLHLTKQETAIICILEHISRNTCDLVNLSSLQLKALHAIEDQTRVSAEMLRAANPQAALDLQQRDELRREIERCCPPEAEKDRCRYEPCHDPGPFEGHPVG